MKFTAEQLQRAARIARAIEELETLRDAADDAQAIVHIGKPDASQPMGDPRVQGVSDPCVVVTVPASSIRAALVGQLQPLYAELRNLRFELQL